MDWTIVLTAVSALAAAAAAGMAAWQAYETRKQVVESKSQGEMTKKQFLQARYDDARPVLIIVSPRQSIPVQQGNERYLDWNRQPNIEVCNVGTGPALNVKSVIYGPEARADSTPSDPDIPSSSPIWYHLDSEEEKKEKEKHWDHWMAKVVRTGEQKKLQHILAPDSSPFQFSQANKFITSKSDKHPYPFNARKQPLSSPGSGEPWPICRVTITYQDIFHRKHASIYDLVFKQEWQAVALLDDIVNDLDDLVKPIR